MYATEMSRKMIHENWSKVSRVPTDRLKAIGFGNLKGKSDINPQWRIKAMTEVYGLCGIGWRYEIANVTYRAGADGREVVFVTVHLFIKFGGEWSYPIVGVGGDMVIETDKNGIHENDEALKMATTDALGNAMKYIGVASEIYEGNFDGSKYKESKDATIQQKAPVQSTGKRASEDQIALILDLATKTNTIMDKIVSAYKCTMVHELSEIDAIGVVNILQKRLEAQNATS